MNRLTDPLGIKIKDHEVIVEVFENDEVNGIKLPAASSLIIRHGVIVKKGKEVDSIYKLEDIVLDYAEQGALPYVHTKKNVEVGVGNEKKKLTDVTRRFFICSGHNLRIVVDPSNFNNEKPDDREDKEEMTLIREPKNPGIITPGQSN